jgi:serine protease Do
LSEYYGIDEGVLINDVFKGDPADKAGIKPKDIIVEVNGQKVETTRQLTSLVADIPVGQTAKVKVLREGKPRVLDVKIGKRDDKRTAARGEAPEKRGEDPLGLRVSALTPEIAQRFNIGETAGVIVTDVQNGSSAEEAGVRVGDIIKEINRVGIESVGDYTAALKKFEKQKSLQLFIWRKNAGFLVLKVNR